MDSMNPTMEEFEALLNESYETHDVVEGSVVKGIITAIEKDLAVIDVGGCRGRPRGSPKCSWRVDTLYSRWWPRWPLRHRPIW